MPGGAGGGGRGRGRGGRRRRFALVPAARAICRAGRHRGRGSWWSECGGLRGARAGLAPVVIAPSDGGQLLGKGVTVENYPGVVVDTGERTRRLVKLLQGARRVDGVRGGASPPRHRRRRASRQAPASSTRCRRTRRTAARRSTRTKCTNIDLSQRPFRVETPEANISAHSLIVATGADSRWLGVDGEATYRGGGVSSCATCDGFLFRDMDVAVVGGGDTAPWRTRWSWRGRPEVRDRPPARFLSGVSRSGGSCAGAPKIRIRWNATVSAFKVKKFTRTR